MYSLLISLMYLLSRCTCKCINPNNIESYHHYYDITEDFAKEIGITCT